MRSDEELTICLPSFNEVERIPATLADIESFVNEYPGIIKEVIVVDDGSVDATSEVSLRWFHRLPLRVERLAENSGKWAAVRHGIMCSSTDAVLLLDADGSASVYELARVKNLVRKLREKTAIFGSRFLKGSSIEGKTALRKCISQGYRLYVLFWYWVATRKRDINDMQCPFKIIYKSELEIENMVVDRFAGDIEMACYLNVRRIVNHPVRFIHKAGSKVPFSAIFSMACETVRVVLRYRKLKRYV